MACIVNIETATAVCSVALSVSGEIVFDKESFEGPSHAALLGVFVQDALRAAKQQGMIVEAVAVSSGPGSYTGLRIGASMAKGLCFGISVPLIGIPTLDILASKVIRQGGQPEGTRYCAMLDARRMEVYAAIYDENLQPIRPTTADIVTAETYAEFLDAGPVCFFGNGAEKCKEVITSPNAIFIDDVVPLAADMVPLANEAFQFSRFENVAYFEPFYLKEFIATVPKNKVLGGK